MAGLLIGRWPLDAQLTTGGVARPIVVADVPAGTVCQKAFFVRTATRVLPSLVMSESPARKGNVMKHNAIRATLVTGAAARGTRWRRHHPRSRRNDTVCAGACRHVREPEARAGLQQLAGLLRRRGAPTPLVPSGPGGVGVSTTGCGCRQATYGGCGLSHPRRRGSPSVGWRHVATTVRRRRSAPARVPQTLLPPLPATSGRQPHPPAGRQRHSPG
jgi:hypothetical protein